MPMSVEIAALWLARASKERVAAAMAANITDGIDAAGSAAIIVVSTRLPRIRMASVMQRISEAAPETPTVVVCHAGGEETARDLVRLGATHVIAEGNEATLCRLEPEAGPGTPPLGEDGIARTMPEPDAEPLVTGFSFEIEQTVNDGRLRSRVDPITNLPTGTAFSLRFADLTQGESLPRIAFIRVANYRAAISSLERQALDLFRRRLVLQFRQVIIGEDIEMFQTDDVEFAFIGPTMNHAQATELCDRLVTAAEGFAPTGGEPVRLAIGHAGPEVANEPRTLRELGERAVQAASLAGGVVSGDELALSEANTTEIEAMLALIAHVDTKAFHRPQHHHRVADIAVAIGRELGIDGIDLIRLRLAARLHDVGLVVGDEDTLATDPSTLSGEALEAYQRHPATGANYVALSTSEDVVSAVRHHHECWDGTGFPDQLEGEDIPFHARVIAVADHIEELNRTGKTDHEIVEIIQAASTTRHDPGIIWAGVTVIKAGTLGADKLPERDLAMA